MKTIKELAKFDDFLLSEIQKLKKELAIQNKLNNAMCVNIEQIKSAMCSKSRQTKREYFAAKALSAFINNQAPQPEWAVMKAIECADAMISELSKEK